MVSPGNGTATVVGIGAGVNVGKTDTPRFCRLGFLGGPRQNRDQVVTMGPSITSVPRTRRQIIIWWCVFTAMMSFIVCVVLKNSFFR